MTSFRDCRREVDACIEGDTIYAECRKPDKWLLIRKSGQHKGMCGTFRKDAKAIILKSYTNVKK
jgi:hypothetical protein